MSLLYDAAALGMGAYTRTAFRVRTLGGEHFRPEPGTIIVSTHRRETDVPLLCPSMYRLARLWVNRSPRISFAAREDLFKPGFFAGFPKGLHPRVRKALYGLCIGYRLSTVQVYPIRSATTIKLEEVFRAEPQARLEELVPAAVVASFHVRAEELGLAGPTRAGDALRGEYADLLWRSFSREELNGPALEAVWSRRASQAVSDFRELVEVVRDGGILLVFPEGRPSPDGEIGSLRPGLAALVRRSRPIRLQPVGLAYDPLTRGRTRAYVSFGRPIPPPEEEIEEAVLRELCLAMPLTCGQVVARRALAGSLSLRALDQELEEAVEVAREEGRNVDPALADPAARRRRLREALRAVAKRTSELGFLAREYASARGESVTC